MDIFVGDSLQKSIRNVIGIVVADSNAWYQMKHLAFSTWNDILHNCGAFATGDSGSANFKTGSCYVPE
jgi:hypothetical protein